VCYLNFRLWFVSDVGRSENVKPPSIETVPSEIGYMNVIPKCVDCSGKYSHYENLPETYAAINVYLAANPLEGRFVKLFRGIATIATAHAHVLYKG